MANKTTTFFSFLTVFSLLFSFTISQKEPKAAPSCSQIIPKVTFCLPYISGYSPSPSEACCNGIKSVASIVKDKNDAVVVCTCLKNNLANIKYEPSLIASLPRKCSVSFDLPAIPKDTDCTKVQPPYFMTMKH